MRLVDTIDNNIEGKHMMSSVLHREDQDEGKEWWQYLRRSSEYG